MNFLKLILTIIIFYSMSVNAQDVEKELKTSITDVTVFLNSAQITRVGTIQIPKGKTNILLRKLSPYIDGNSIQVNAKGDFTILSVNYSMDYLQEPASTEKINELTKQIAAIDDSLSYYKALSETNAGTLDMLDKNKKIGNENTGTDINQLKLAVKYYEQEVISIKTGEIHNVKRSKELQDLRTKLNNQLSQMNSQQNRPTGIITIEIESDKSVEGVFTVKYQASNASWKPMYDLRAVDVSSPVELYYYASVTQNTGEDWNNVNIGFSNANPNQSGTAPQIQPWYLDFIQMNATRGYLMNKEKAASGIPEVKPMAASLDKEENARTMEVNVQENQTSFSFRVNNPYSVKSGTENSKIQLMKYSIPATYRYFVVPKLDDNAFLIASITGWDQYNLLQGEANLYFENTFVGKSIIDPDIQSDTMSISLGRDKSVIVSRKKVDTYSQKKFIGTNKIETRGFDISVRNNKSKSIDLTIKDQIPVSTRSEITVNALETGGADFDKTTGILTWLLKLNPQEQKDLKFQYEVRYPKNQRVILE